MVDLTALNATIAKLTDQATKTEGTEASAGLVIAAQGEATKKAVTDALTADDAADNGSVAVAQQAVDAVTARFAAADGPLGAAIAANPGTAPIPPLAPAA